MGGFVGSQLVGGGSRGRSGRIIFRSTGFGRRVVGIVHWDPEMTDAGREVEDAAISKIHWAFRPMRGGCSRAVRTPIGAESARIASCFPIRVILVG